MRRTRFVSVYLLHTLHLDDSRVLSRMLSISCVLQAGNIFAALSQGQSDDDEDLEKEDKPLRKVIKLHEGP